MKEFFSQSKREGQVIIEAMVAIGIITTGALGVLTLLSNSLSLNRVVADQYVATYLAAEGIEIVKNAIDSNIIKKDPWNKNLFSSNPFEAEFDYSDDVSGQGVTAFPFDGTGRFFLLDQDTGRYSYDGGGSSSQTTIKRKVAIESLGADEVRVTSRVDWVTRGGGSFSLTLEDHFFNWRPVTP